MENLDEKRAKVRARKAENMRRYRAENPERYRAHTRAANRKTRTRLLELYGAVCCLCDFDDVRALTLDHILNNGAQERTELGERGVYRRALKQENRQEYRILCMNCQFITRHDGGRQNQHTSTPAVSQLAWRTLTR